MQRIPAKYEIIVRLCVGVGWRSGLRFRSRHFMSTGSTLGRLNSAPQQGLLVQTKGLHFWCSHLSSSEMWMEGQLARILLLIFALMV